MASIFFRVLRDEQLRSQLLSYMDTDSICALRLTATECYDFTTPILFTRTRLTFTASSLTRPSRLEALSRIGHLIEHLTFSMPHSEATFLPPLIHPLTGREVNFLYTPHTTAASVTQRPKYGSPELGEVLTQQFPPIFHAATNVPAFINALSLLPNLRHLTISCPGQDPAQRYRRDVVDYALISLRIAIERAPLLKLEKLSISQIHPAGIQYLRHMPGYGCTPSAGRRWKQIRKLNINMDSWDFSGSRPGRDHLKILDDYIRSFSSNLEKVTFGWNGRKGPCPFTLFTDPMFAPPKQTTKLFAEVTSPMSPLPAAPFRPAMSFPKLKYMQLRNATMSTEQVSDFVLEHRHTVREFDFDNVSLINGGVWEDALAPLSRLSGSDEWLSQQSGSEADSTASIQSHEESNDYRDYLDRIEEQDEVADTILPLGGPTIPAETSRTSVVVQKKKVHRRRRKRKQNHPKDKTTESKPKLAISAPIPIEAPVEEMLLPAIFNPNVQGVQRDLKKEESQRELAEDPDIRVSTLRKAKEAVLKQLSREFCRSQDRKGQVRGLFSNSCASRSRMFMNNDSGTALVPLMFSRY